MSVPTDLSVLGMKQELIKILLVEDELLQVRLLQEFLSSTETQSFHLVYTHRLSDGICQAQADPFDVILLDLTLPDSHGLASLTSLNKAMPMLPIVVLTNTNDNELAVEAVRLGAQDYLVKNQITPELLTRSLRYAIERKQTAELLRRHNETLELRVQERTAELTQANQTLEQEVERRQQIQTALAQEKELAQVTLQSIGDAVITTNAKGQVESLNPVAEVLTGWAAQDAQGQPLNQVLQLFCDDSKQLISNPVSRVLATGQGTSRATRTILKNKYGREFVVEHSAAPIHLSNGYLQGVVLVCRDMTYTHQLVSQLSWQACHDPLTGLINRREFERHLQDAVLNAKQLDSSCSLCFIDLDRFKVINDTCGHAAGDELLRQISALLQQRIRKTDRIARLGGDEFGLLLPDCKEEEGLKRLEQLLEVIRAFRFSWEERTFSIGASMGLVLIDADTESSAQVLSTVDTAMYTAKKQGGHRIQVYQSGDGRLATLSSYKWVSPIIKALETNGFCLYAQQITSLQPAHQSPERYELLLRMKDHQGQLISPGEFVPAAERYNLMPEVDQWVIRHLFCELQMCGISTPSIYSINLSGATLSSDELLDFVQEQFSRYQIDYSSICFEVTETYAMTNLKKVVAFIQALKGLGCQFALDDFGRGMSSLGCLKELPVDYLKIDGCFIRNIVNDPISAAMVESIHHIAHVMGLKTVAEYVVNQQTLDMLQVLKIDYGQGYAIAKPLPLSTILKQDSTQPKTSQGLLTV